MCVQLARFDVKPKLKVDLNHCLKPLQQVVPQVLVALNRKIIRQKQLCRVIELLVFESLNSRTVRTT